MYEPLVPLIRPVASIVVSLIDKVRGTRPTADFRPTGGGVVLHLMNPRHETVIIEAIEATPKLLTFSAGNEIRDLVVAMVGSELALAALSPKEEASFHLIAVAPFETAVPNTKIKVVVKWRAANRSVFSVGKISKTTTARDIKDLREEAERRRARPLFTSV